MERVGMEKDTYVYAFPLLPTLSYIYTYIYVCKREYICIYT